MVRWWAVFFVAGMFSPCDPIKCFIPILIIAMDQWRNRPLVHLVLFPSLIEKHGDCRLQAVRIRDFILISSTGIIVMSAAGISFRTPVPDSLHVKTEKSRNISLSADKKGSPDSDLVCRCEKTAGKWIEAIRGHLYDRIDDPGIDRRSGQILRALLMAERNSIDASLNEEFRFLGISHFLALSGLHLGIIAVSFSLLLRFPCPQRGIREIILFCVLLVYIAVVRYPHSLLRAVSLYASFRIFRYSGIRSSLEDALIAGSLLLISVQPDLLFSKGYQLSFLAVSAISLIAIPLIRMLRGSVPWIKERKFAGFLVSSVIVTLSIQIFTLPLILEYFGRVPLISPAANLLFIIPVTAVLHLGLLHVLLPSAITAYTTAPLLRHISLLLYAMPAFLLKCTQPAILKGQIENISYFAGLLFLKISLGNVCSKRKTVFISSVLCFLFSFIAGNMNSKADQMLLKSDPGVVSKLDTKGITHYIGDNKTVIIDSILSFPRMERYISSLWRAGISQIDIIIITPGTLKNRKGLSHLIKRMKTKTVYCSPYIEESISEMIENRISRKITVKAVDSNITLYDCFGEITIIPPGHRLKQGGRIDAETSGIKYTIKYYLNCYDNN